MIEINKKEDVVIPFDSLSDPDWEVKTTEILSSLADIWGETLSAPKTEAEIERLERRLGAALPDELKLFYSRFGLADIGEELIEFDEIGWVKDIWEDPEMGPEFFEEDLEILPYLVAFSVTGGGNMFCFHTETEEVYFFDHDSDPFISKIFPSVSDYLRASLIEAQHPLGGAGTDEDDVLEWIEETLISLYGANTITKWLY